ncbi:MAG: hypothetical protein FWE71_10890 [Nocardioidaceae bacterium]|nr:hypothetical protein [Nocardioidaceae bacterium]MCL2611880.1 hypothetical protein [Nocardioidaceae bacterium]
MSESNSASTEVGTVPDEDLPDDLVPGEDNPLAEGLPPGETAESMRDREAREAEEKKGPQDESE